MHYVLTKIFAKVSRKQELQLGNILTSKNIVDFLDKLNYTEGIQSNLYYICENSKLIRFRKSVFSL